MRLGGRLAAAIEVLDDIQRRHRPVADALKDWGVSHRFAGSGDRSAIGNIVYDALRRKRSAGWLLDGDTPRAQAVGVLLLEWGMTPDAINAAIEGDKFAPEPLSPEDVAAVASRNLANAPEVVRADAPDWCLPLFEQAFGSGWVSEAAALSARPPLDLRVNTLLADRGSVLQKMDDIQASPTSLAPNGIRIPPIVGDGRHPNVQAEPAFQMGRFEVQDEGSQIVSLLADAAPGMAVLDYCAGGGGKTLAMAAVMANSGTIHAHDSDKRRLAPIFDRLRRAGVTNVEVSARAAELAPLTGKMDLVLIDAPCTGSGTWRRRPDAKWRLTQKQLDLRCAEQTAILETAAGFVKPDGRLAYITCSVFDAENRQQIERFLATHPQFRVVDHSALWSRHFPRATERALVYRQFGIRLTPRISGTDGFYFAALERAA